MYLKYFKVPSRAEGDPPPPAGRGGGKGEGGWGLSLLPNFQKEGLTGSQFLEGGCWEKKG